MYKIKQVPEDFVVKEIPQFKLIKDGSYSYFKLIKRDLTTIGAIDSIKNKFKIKKMGFAGNKDKRAITEQYLSIFGLNKDRINKLIDLKGEKIKIWFIGKGDEPISLGDLKGNSFEITIRSLNKNFRLNKSKRFPNYFGEQRFSKNNAMIGKAIIKRDFKTAADLILKNKGNQENLLREHLNEDRNDFVGALKKLNKKILMIYIHSYQSYLFNNTVELYLKNKDIKKFKDMEMPLIGFGLEINKIKNKELRTITNKILVEEQINPREFIIREMPELSSEGGLRDLFSEVKNLRINKIEKDELNKGKYKIKVKFELDKGCYATVLIKELFRVT